ncbi:MAG: hypothetical protein ACRDCE_17430, partial [Cetobacterium sp.]|uniref:hypothetical protein n=1 Tax=Cetobacterium sp. TaxID=2071632 RepID=UPI003EE4CE63
MAMKMKVTALSIMSVLVAGCGEAETALTQEQLFDLKKMEMQQDHELRMKREEVRAQQGIVVVNEESNPQVQAAP